MVSSTRFGRMSRPLPIFDPQARVGRGGKNPGWRLKGRFEHWRRLRVVAFRSRMKYSEGRVGRSREDEKRGGGKGN